jgi:hypothetical protein
MKLIPFLIIVCSAVFAQTPSQYHVVRVVGTVESPVLKRALKTGDIIQSKDQLRFATRDSYIIVNSPETGRKRISGVPDATPRELLQLLQSFVQPDTKSTSSRSIAMEYVKTLENSMAFDTLLVLGDGFVPVITSKLSLTSPAVICAWHHGANGKIVSRVISNDKGFSLQGQLLYEEPDSRTRPFSTKKIVVEYFGEGNAEPDPVFNPGLLLGAFVPLYVNEDQLATEIRSLMAGRNRSNKEVTDLQEVEEYLRQEYAMAQQDNLKTWLKEHGISIQ